MNSNISFIIPVYNGEDFIEDAVNSILQKRNFSEGDEIIIINDASTDRTQIILSELQKKHTEIRILNHNINKGSAAAGRNTGIDSAKNELIFCLDSDNILDTNTVPLLKNFLINENLDAVAFGEIHYFIDSPDEVVEISEMNETITFLNNINDIYKSPSGSGNYLFTKSIWKKAGRQNEFLGGALDSWAFGCSKLAVGANFKTLKNTKYFHKKGYESTYIRNMENTNISYLIGQILYPYFDLIHPIDREYILSYRNRNSWFYSLEKRPIRGAADFTNSIFDKLFFKAKWYFFNGV